MKTNNRKYYINIGLLLITLFASGCYYDQVVPEVVELPDEPVSYSMDIQPFFDAKCVSCHNGGGIPLDLSSAVSYDELLDGYVDITDPEGSLLYTKMALGGSMEQYATPTELAITLKWIKEGANND
jgi:hypothetical protein